MLREIFDKDYCILMLGLFCGGVSVMIVSMGYSAVIVGLLTGILSTVSMRILVYALRK